MSRTTRNPANPAIKRFPDRIAREYKKLTWQSRAVPDFIIIGCQKGGTSSLHNYLLQHPRLFAGDIKEVHFFDGGLDPQWDKFAEGERLYRSYFPKVSRVKSVDGLTFEATPEYMHNPDAPARMAQMLPSAKLIVLLRDPSERTISNYFHEVRRGREKRSIMEALLSEESTLKSVEERGNFKDTRWIWKAYVKRSLYAEQLERVFQHYPKEQVLVMESKDLYRSPDAVLTKVLQFIGIEDREFHVNLTPVGVGTNRRKVSEKVYGWLEERFRHPNAQLERLLNRQFSWTQK